MSTGALSPSLLNLLNSAAIGGSNTVAPISGAGFGNSMPSAGQYTGLGARVYAGAANTYFFNQDLWNAAGLRTTTEYEAGGFYTGIPPIFGGTAFQGLPPVKYDFFGKQQGGLFGVDLILATQNAVNPPSASPDPFKVSTPPATPATPAEAPKPPAANGSTVFTLEQLKSMKLGDLLSLLAK